MDWLVTFIFLTAETTVSVTTGSDDSTLPDINIVLAIAALVVILLVIPKKRPLTREQEIKLAGKYAGDFQDKDNAFVNALTEKANKVISSAQIHPFLVTVGSSGITFQQEDEKKETKVSYKELIYADLKEENHAAVACALMLRFGDRGHLCVDEKNQPTAQIKIDGVPLKDPNLQKAKP